MNDNESRPETTRNDTTNTVRVGLATPKFGKFNKTGYAPMLNR